MRLNDALDDVARQADGEPADRMAGITAKARARRHRKAAVAAMAVVALGGATVAGVTLVQPNPMRATTLTQPSESSAPSTSAASEAADAERFSNEHFKLVTIKYTSPVTGELATTHLAIGVEDEAEALTATMSAKLGSPLLIVLDGQGLFSAGYPKSGDQVTIITTGPGPDGGEPEQKYVLPGKAEIAEPSIHSTDDFDKFNFVSMMIPRYTAEISARDLRAIGMRLASKSAQDGAGSGTVKGARFVTVKEKRHSPRREVVYEVPVAADSKVKVTTGIFTEEPGNAQVLVESDDHIEELPAAGDRVKFIKVTPSSTDARGESPYTIVVGIDAEVDMTARRNNGLDVPTENEGTVLSLGPLLLDLDTARSLRSSNLEYAAEMENYSAK